MRLVLAALLVLAPCSSVGQASPLPSSAIPEPLIEGGRLGKAYAPLIDQLRVGGLVILFRHERTETMGDWDYVPYKTGECEQQRVLSPVGRESARAVGEAIRALGIKAGSVVSSTYCRAVEHARIGFGGVHEQVAGLIGGDGKKRTLEMVRRDVDRLIQSMPKQGNLVLIGHHGTTDAYTARMLDEGDALILKPNKQGSADIVAHMPSARWEEILRDQRRAEIERLSKE